MFKCIYVLHPQKPYYNINLNDHLLNCAFMFVYFIQKGKIININ